MSKYVLGIDLGTTFSSVAFINDNGLPEVIRNADGKTSTPSVVLIQDGQVLVGDVALNQWITNEEHVVRWIKRAMGNPDYRFQGLTAVEISAEILKALKADAEAKLGVTCDEAVITCPAYFAALEIENTLKAGQLAGFTVKEIVKEPTAAAVYYGVENMRPGERIMVCDLGGGTYDATLLSYENGVFKPLASDGNRELGGHDWTLTLQSMVIKRFKTQFHDDPSTDLIASQMLYEACESAKRDFARLDKVSIPCGCRGRTEFITITRDEFEAKTESLITTLVLRTNECVAKAGKTWADINTILMVGGSSRLRRVGPALEKASGIKPILSKDPDLSVALGAAILATGKVKARRIGLTDAKAGGLVDVVPVVTRILPRSMGTRVAVVKKGVPPYMACSEIIPRNAEVPITRSRDDYAISVNDQAYFDLPVVEFENDDDFVPIDSFRFTCLPGAQRGDRVCVTFHYDINGIPTVEARDLKSGQALVGTRLPYEEPDLSKARPGGVRLKPRWIVFAIDTSGSMGGFKLDCAKRALIDNARQLIGLAGETTRVGVVSFSSTAEVACLPTNDLRRLESAVNALQVTGMTSMDDGILLAVQVATTAPPGTDMDVVMLTDGMPDADRRGSTVAAATQAKEMGITLSTIGIGQQDVDIAFLQQLTPFSLVIESSDDMTASIDSVLTLADNSRGGGITDATGALME